MNQTWTIIIVGALLFFFASLFSLRLKNFRRCHYCGALHNRIGRRITMLDQSVGVRMHRFPHSTCSECYCINKSNYSDEYRN